MFAQLDFSSDSSPLSRVVTISSKATPRDRMSKLFIYVFLTSVLTQLVNCQDVPSTPAGSSRKGQGCGFVKTSLSGRILSPGYPLNYPPSSVCKWTIHSPPKTLIKLSFSDFMVEGSTECKSDYLLIFDGPNSTSPKVGRYCNIAPEKFTSSSNSVHLEFYSDAALNHRGFYANYSTIQATTVTPTTQWRKRPTFSQFLSNKTVFVGDMFELICEAKGAPDPSIFWTKNSKNLTRSDRIGITYNGLKTTLTINNIDSNDQGMYSCMAYNGYGKLVQTTSWLTVKEKMVPVIKKATEDLTVGIGTEVRLKCKASGTPPLKIRWKDKNVLLARSRCETSQDCRVETTQTVFKHSVITCEVVNAAGNASRKVLVNIKGPPIIIEAPKDLKAKTGSSVNFTCEALGNPPVIISWMRDNKTVSKGVEKHGRRSVIRFSAERNTTVTCVARDKDGVKLREAQLITDTSGVDNSPRRLSFVKHPTDMNLQYKSSTTVECQAKGTPTPRLSWTKNGVKITEGVVDSKKISTLVLTEITETLTIACIAKNKREEIRYEATITVEPDPDIKKDSISKNSDTISTDTKLILGAVGGLLTIIFLIIFFLRVLRKKKKVIKEAEKVENRVESENLISNPIYNSERSESDNKTGIESLHFPRDDIIHCEDISEDENIQVFVGSATGLPLSSGEEKVLVKVLKDNDPCEERRKQFASEAALLASFHHSNVVRLMAACVKTTPFCLLFEYSEYGYLDEYLQDCDSTEFQRSNKRKPEHVRDSYAELGNVDRLSIAKQIAAAMQYLTEKGYVHRELRSRNCMVFQNLTIKVGSLGLNWVKQEQNFFAMDQSEKKNYPVRWLSPEVILYGEQEHSEAADVWSYAVVVWEVFSDGLLPYTGINDNDVVGYVRGCNVLPCPKTCPQDVYEVLKTCWEITPTDRPNFVSLHETMSTLHAGVRV